MVKFMSATTFVLLVVAAILTLAETRPQDDGLLDRELVKMLTQLTSKQDLVSSRSEKTMDKMLNHLKKKQYPECGGSFTASKGVITSPGYPGRYFNNMNCEYSIVAEEGTTIILDFIRFSVEGPVSENCPYDYIQIFDSLNPDGSFVYLQKLCGPYLDRAFESSSNNIAFTFVTDGTKTEAGFQAVWYTRPAAIAVAPTAAPTKTTDHLHSTGCGLRPLAKNNGESEIYDFAKRIIGGHHAEENTWPSICRLYFTTNHYHEGPKGPYGCAGTLVKNNQGLFVLITAAHCTDPSSIPERDYQVYCGIHYLNDPSTALKIRNVVAHSGYNHDDDQDHNNDIAIIFFENQPEESVFIQAACIADEDHTANETSITVGWGNTIDHKDDYASNTLKQVTRKLLSDEECLQGDYDHYEKSIMMCTYSKNSGSCQGDSGGPVFTYRHKRWTLTGVTSFGIGCVNYDYEADVYDFRDWIDRLINRY